MAKYVHYTHFFMRTRLLDIFQPAMVIWLSTSQQYTRELLGVGDITLFSQRIYGNYKNVFFQSQSKNFTENPYICNKLYQGCNYAILKALTHLFSMHPFSTP